MLKSSTVAALKTGVGGGVAVNLLAAVSTLPFLLVPHTACVRAGGWGLLVAAGAVYSLAVLLPRSWREVRGGQLAAGSLGLVLALTPLPLADWLFHLCAQAKGFQLAP